MLGFDSVYEVLRQLGRLAEALGDGGGDVDVQGVALLNARPLAAQRDVGARLRGNVLHVAALCMAAARCQMLQHINAGQWRLYSIAQQS